MLKEKLDTVVCQKLELDHAIEPDLKKWNEFLNNLQFQTRNKYCINWQIC